jgi:hypothetical protein
MASTKEAANEGGLHEYGQRVQATQAARNVALRRTAMKPRLTKPRITIAQVEGSGTAAVSVN